MKKYLKTAEFAREIGLHPNTVRAMEKDGRLIPHHKNAAGYRFYSVNQVEEYFAKHKGGN